jgi:hypothetical protein
MNPPYPPRPLCIGSTTPNMKQAATAASTALPPFFNVSTAAWATSGCGAATMAVEATASWFVPTTTSSGE